ncbi:MAG: DNA replication/repair protein RecF [Clostridia bacterium]|nr:DNA replication/repair protein RecF [Clostridia bacterium]
MQCKKIEVENFRNIAHASVEFGPQVNLLLGDNAQGKTNLLEAVSLMALGRSFRGAKDADLIRFGQDKATIALDYCDHIRDMRLTATLMAGRRRKMEQNGLPVAKMSELIGGLRVVLFCPEHLSIIKSGPELRRNFLDVAISQLKPVYMSALGRYNKILKERNRLLKEASESEDARRIMQDTIDIWSEQLAKEGALIARYRVQYIQKMKQAASVVFLDMTGGGEVPNFSYVGTAHLDCEDDYLDTVKTEKAFFELLTTSHAREVGAGYTLWGIHRDDIDITLNGVCARLFASQGQQRSLALAMKLAEGEICRESCLEHPVYLFDDVLSELDVRRRDYLTSRIYDKQVILTTCEPSEMKRMGDANVIKVQNGTFCAL